MGKIKSLTSSVLEQDQRNHFKKETDSFVVTSEYPWVYLVVDEEADLTRPSSSLFGLAVKPTTQKNLSLVYEQSTKNHKLKVLRLFSYAAYLLERNPKRSLLLGQLNRNFYDSISDEVRRHQEELSQDFLSWTRTEGLYLPVHIEAYLRQAGIVFDDSQVTSQEIQKLLLPFATSVPLKKVGD